MDTIQRFEAWAGRSAAVDEMKKAHARACKEWASICRMQKRHGCSVGASECAKLILASEED